MQGYQFNDSEFQAQFKDLTGVYHFKHFRWNVRTDPANLSSSHPVAVQNRRARPTVQRPGAAAPATACPVKALLATVPCQGAALPTQQQGTRHAAASP